MDFFKKECKGCRHWRMVCSGGESGQMFACHCLLDTGNRRKEANGICISRKARKVKE